MITKNNDFGGLFWEYGLFDKILNNFGALTFSFIVRENYLEFCQTGYTLRTDHPNRHF